MKKFENPMLQIVSIKECDIVTASNPALTTEEFQQGDVILAPGQRGLDDWDAGY